MLENIAFTYDKGKDDLCHERFREFIARHKTVWGRTPNTKEIVSLKHVDLDIDVREIAGVYEKIFGITDLRVDGYIVTTPYSMIDDDVAFDSRHSTLFYSIYNLFGYPPSVVIGHELFHIFFEKFTERNIHDYETSKEYFTVIMNDLFGKAVSKGYPEHEEIRAKILEIWQKTKSMKETVAVFKNELSVQ